jgi:3-oxoacyl-[acyl-carrier protein] reductase
MRLTTDLTGKSLLATGAASGIGLATAERMARMGAAVAINHLPDDPRGAEQVARLKAEGLSVISAPGDVGKPQDAARMVAAALDRLGGLDFLFNNAGTPGGPEPYDMTKLELMTEEFWSMLLNVNLISIFRVTRAARDALVARKGAVVNTASVAGINMRGSSIAYGATKAGIINLTINLARGLAPHVRVNAVAPGLVDSPWTRDWPQARKDTLTGRTMLKRMATPDDIADAAIFLLCGSAYMTGQTVVVDGGMIHGE